MSQGRKQRVDEKMRAQAAKVLAPGETFIAALSASRLAPAISVPLFLVFVLVSGVIDLPLVAGLPLAAAIGIITRPRYLVFTDQRIVALEPRIFGGGGPRLVFGAGADNGVEASTKRFLRFEVRVIVSTPGRSKRFPLNGPWERDADEVLQTWRRAIESPTA